MLAAAGLSNRQIAERLSVSVRTVGGRIFRIFAKLGIERREQLIHLVRGALSGCDSTLATNPVSSARTRRRFASLQFHGTGSYIVRTPGWI
jgi:FixJ family two-component response regulator